MTYIRKILEFLFESNLYITTFSEALDLYILCEPKKWTKTKTKICMQKR